MATKSNSKEPTADAKAPSNGGLTGNDKKDAFEK